MLVDVQKMSMHPILFCHCSAKNLVVFFGHPAQLTHLEDKSAEAFHSHRTSNLKFQWTSHGKWEHLSIHHDLQVSTLKIHLLNMCVCLSIYIYLYDIWIYTYMGHHILHNIYWCQPTATAENPLTPLLPIGWHWCQTCICVCNVYRLYRYYSLGVAPS